MKATCTFPEIVNRTEKAASDTWDTTVSPTALAMRDGALSLDIEGDRSVNLKPNTWALGQLCTKLGIPSGYFKRCPPSLQDLQFEYWMRRFAESGQPDRQLFLRASGLTLRGVLSEKYACIDNSKLIEAVEPLMEDGLIVTWFELTDVSFHLRLVSPKIGSGDDDPILAGVHIANSEVGMRTLTINAILYRQVCTNGMVRLVRNQNLYARKHIGAQPENLCEIIQLSAREALDTGRIELNKLQQSRNFRITEPKSTLDNLSKAWTLTESVLETIQRQLPMNRLAFTAFDLINAITATAQLQPADERYRLETLAGSLLDRDLSRL
ncbi:MAG: hypothetical protein KF784_00095 [Fimbriimonadaceae bacterium]|nr:hypothetical protein [Fimbriimonadaceae bacterium]